MSGKPAPRILHLHSAFDPGGKELRAVQLMNAFGPNVRHEIVSGEADKTGARELINRSIKVDYPVDFPSLKGAPGFGRYRKIAEAMKPYDLVLTYNWGAMDAVMAHTLFAQAMKLPHLVHHEDGFNEDEASKLKRRRNWFRRIALGRTSALVVPSQTLEHIALDVWQQPSRRVYRIPNGVDTAAFAKKPKRDALPALIKRKDEFWVGSMAGLRPVKNLPALVRAFSALPDKWQLVIFGDGPEKQAIAEAAKACRIEHRVHLPGFADPARVVGLFDIFALSSHSEQFPISVVEAMAAGLPVAAPDVGDVSAIVSKTNKPFIVPAGDEPALGAALKQLAEDGALRKEIGEANRRRAVECFDAEQMIASYRALYARALGLGDMP